MLRSVLLVSRYSASIRLLSTKTLALKETNSQFSGEIPIDKLEINCVKSSGPGGQNVNKINSKVEIRFHVPTAEWIPDDIRHNFILREEGRINKDGYFIITSDRTRKQIYNQADCLDRIRVAVQAAVNPPKPEPTPEEKELAESRKTKAVENRISDKKIKSLTKMSRGAV